jgi:hypothetical protein
MKIFITILSSLFCFSQLFSQSKQEVELNISKISISPNKKLEQYPISEFECVQNKLIQCNIDEDYDKYFEGLFGLKRAIYKGKLGFINRKKEVIISFNYSVAKSNFDGFHIITGQFILNNDEKYGVLNDFNEIVIPFEYDSLAVFFDDYYIAKKSNKIGFFDKYGNIKIPFEYDKFIGNVGGDNYTALILEKNKKTGVVDFFNKVRLPFEYEWVGKLSIKDYFLASNSQFVNFFNFENKPLFKNKYSSIEPSDYAYEHLKVRLNGKWGVIDITENVLVPIKYSEGTSYGNINHIYQGNKMGIYDIAKRKEIYPPIYEEVRMVNEKSAIIRENGKYGFVKGEKIKIPFEYTSIDTNTNDFNLLMCEKNGIVYRYDLTKERFEEKYDDFISGSFVDFYKKKGKWGIIKDDKVFVAIYDSLSFMLHFERHTKRPLEAGDIFFKKNGTWGVMNNVDLTIFIPAEYQEIRYIADGVYGVKKGNLWAINFLYDNFKTQHLYKIIEYDERLNVLILDGIPFTRIKKGMVRIE